MNSKRIGGDYERVTSKNLSKWLTGSEEELVVWRTAGSGSVATIRKKKGLNGNTLDGDFQCLNPKYQLWFNTFYMDSKSLTDVNLFLIAEKNASNQLLTEWEKVKKDAGSKLSLMFVKLRGNKKVEDFIVAPWGVKPFLILNNYIEYRVHTEFHNDRLFIMSQREFFSLNNWEHILKKISSIS